MTVQESLAAAGYLMGWRVARLLPERLVLRVAYRAADWACDQGKGMDQLRRNLARVVGQENVTRELVRRSMRSYARYWVEAFRLPSMHTRPDLIERLEETIEGKEHLEASVAKGKGVVLVLPHSGNWDMAGVFLVHHCGAFTTVAERLKPEVLYQAFVDFRTSLGFQVLPLTGEGSAYPRLKAVLESGGIVCLLGERDIRQRGVPTSFFGEETTMPAGPVKLAEETDAALHVVHSWYPEEGRWGLRCGPEIPVTNLADTVQRVATQMEENIRRHPADWHLLQPLWPEDVERRRRLKNRTQGAK
ncbi:phosphatidylinositol mannoside acyltransferase [Corynebacterium uropygiale]|uniref:Phosphatidylinositol mannoside acyltransferase n=1 Tax=Corynebacterium uropygiale TaxID=1775911 RepID=A0A9X1QQU3_9CORY|nr:phosphatidylinositol mannoside acyltransferase [Corynebacterium uropygiale]MCF4006520.1 phosphatidylinositol mannoside acyltransferase [Corynebacterium uropygiale]